MVQANLFPSKVTREALNNLVDKAADLIRTAVDYKFILVLLFLKRLNDLWKREKVQAKERLVKEAKLSERDAEEEAEKVETFHVFNIPKQYLWDEVTKDVKNLPEKLATGISEVAKLNTELQGVINRVDFLEFARNQENRELLRQLTELFNKYDLGGEEVSPDVLGDAYEHILMKFAPQKAKEGEIYTPREVIRLMVEMLDPKPGESVYDPCCGSGGMLILSHMHVAEKYGKEETSKLFLYGQERNPEIYSVCQMNLNIHGIRNGNITNGDTLDYPKFKEDGNLKQFDLVLANPPWNQDGYGEERLKKAEFRERFSLGYPPNNTADWAWIQHMLSSSKGSGKVGIILDENALSREAAERIIRSSIVDKNFVECVILLAGKLFYNTGAAGVLIIFNKNKAGERKDKVLFINATQEYGKHPNVRRLNTLEEKNIQRIADAYRQYRDVKGFATVVSLERIREKEYDLNVALHAPLPRKELPVDLNQVYQELRRLEQTEMEEKKVQDWLEGILGLTGEGFYEETEYRRTEVGEIPRDWDIKKLGDSEAAVIVMGQSPPSHTYNRRGTGLHFLQGNADFGDIYPNPQLYTSKPIKIAEKDDILISVRAPVGEINIAPFKCCIGRGLAAIRPNPCKLDSKFVFYYLKHMAKLFIGRGSTFKAIKRKDLDVFLILIPPLTEQRRIAEILSSVDRELEKESLKKSLLSNAMKGLMSRMLNGKTRARVD